MRIPETVIIKNPGDGIMVVTVVTPKVDDIRVLNPREQHELKKGDAVSVFMYPETAVTVILKTVAVTVKVPAR